VWCVKRTSLLLVLVLLLPVQAWAGFLAHGSTIEPERMKYEYYAFEADYALIGGMRAYGYGTYIPDSAYRRIYDERHDRFHGFGAAGNKTLTVDESLRRDVERVLGKTMRLDVGGYEERMLCYASSRPGDDTVVLFTLAHCPYDCSRVSEIQVRARKREVRVLKKCASVPGVSRDIATESGLRLGMTAKEVKAILGVPQHVQKGLQGTMWFYAASVGVYMSHDEAVRRGFPGIEHVTIPGTCAAPVPGFDKYIVLWLRQGRVSAWRVWLDWSL